MRVKLSHAPYIARKIAIDIVNTDFITVNVSLEDIIDIAKAVIEEDIKNEQRLDAKVNEMLEDFDEESSDEEYSGVDYGQIFWQIKRKLAKEYEVILDKDERYNELSHRVLDEYWQEEAIDYTVAENKVRNVILESINNYLKNFDIVEDAVHQRLKTYKRKLIPGTEDYDMVYQKTYEDELKKRGML
jgi:hypothetical protein